MADKLAKRQLHSIGASQALLHCSDEFVDDLLCNLSSQLQSVCSVMICQLGSSLLAESVSSGAVRQLSCDVSA